jgi:hypothetical protein
MRSQITLPAVRTRGAQSSQRAVSAWSCLVPISYARRPRSFASFPSGVEEQAAAPSLGGCTLNVHRVNEAILANGRVRRRLPRAVVRRTGARSVERGGILTRRRPPPHCGALKGDVRDSLWGRAYSPRNPPARRSRLCEVLNAPALCNRHVRVRRSGGSRPMPPQGQETDKPR